MMIANALVEVKGAPPYVPELGVAVSMNSVAPATLDVRTGSYEYTNRLTT
jgi:hypothetical protein